LARATKVIEMLLFILAILTLLSLLIIVLQKDLSLFTVTGDSMSPALPAGSIAIVQPVAGSEISTDDIIAYHAPGGRGTTVTHRVVEVTNEGESLSFQTAGDGNDNSDKSPVPSENVVGKVIFHIPYVGFVLSFVKQPVGYCLLIGLPALVIILIEMRRIANQISSLKAGSRHKAS